MKEKIESVIELLDIPSGSILGLFTLIVIGMSVAAFAKHTEIPATVITIYQTVLGAFAGSKAVQTVWGKPTNNETKPQG